MNRDDFPMLQGDLIYFDNGATTMKPNCVIDGIVDYYRNYTANAHRGDYDTSLKVDTMYEGVREKVRHFIDGEDASSVVFTSGTTDSLNRIVFGYMKYHLQPGDEVLLTKAEHASNILPWLELAKECGIVVRYIPLTVDNELTIEAVMNTVTEHTKVISIAHVSNVIGDVRPVSEIGDYCQKHGILFVVDGAQSVPHLPVSVTKMHIDFLAFSAHKMLGPTGVGVLYGRKDLLDEMHPTSFGGGMNASFTSEGDVSYREVPTRFEAGTPNIAGVIGLGYAIDYLENIGMENVHAHELMLKDYLLSRIKEINNVEVYNANVSGSTVIFNLKDVFSQDTAVFLNHFHICVRAGNHCAKILKDQIHVANTCRISFYFYNTKEEIDRLIEALKMSDKVFEIVL